MPLAPYLCHPYKTSLSIASLISYLSLERFNLKHLILQVLCFPRPSAKPHSAMWLRYLDEDQSLLWDVATFDFKEVAQKRAAIDLGTLAIWSGICVHWWQRPPRILL